MTRDAYIGLISGTSMDGIDAVLVEFDGDRPHLIATHQGAWPADLLGRLQRLAVGEACDKNELGVLDNLAGETFAATALELLAQSGVPPAAVCAVGSHGQTIGHDTRGEAAWTLQIGDPNRIAARTGITTVADFRRRDMAYAGEGAPLVPAFHNALFRSPTEDRAVLNLGGIANLTLLPQDDDVTGFDTGPANCLMDHWSQARRVQPFDAFGAWGASGQVDDELLERMLADQFFALLPPKSTGTQYFSASWLEAHLAGSPSISAEDVQATLAELTARTVQQALKQFAPDTQRVLVCGGGVHNRYLMTRLGVLLEPRTVQDTAVSGLPPDWVEATAFAWLARETLAGRPGNLPSVTGARQASVLGAIYPGG